MGQRQRQQQKRPRRGVRGFFLLGVLMLIALLGTLIAVGLTRSTTEKAAATRFVDNERAFQLAEAGVDDALVALKASSLKWNDELVGADGVAGTPDDGVLGIEPTVLFPQSTYAVRVFDNADERAPAPNNPTEDADGIIRIVATGTVAQSQRRLELSLWALFNHAIAAQVDILLRQASALGDIHANHNIEVRQTSELFGYSQATAAGSFVIPPGETLIHTYGDLNGGDPPITFFRPDVAALRAAVTTWDPSNWRGTIQLNDRDVAGYERPLAQVPNTPQTVALTGTATIAVFDGHSIRFRQRIGSFHQNGTCLAPMNLSVIAVGGSITFEQPVCLRGLVWAGGSVTIAQESTISGAIVSAGGSIDVKQGSVITFNRTAIDASILPGFSGVTVLSWQEL